MVTRIFILWLLVIVNHSQAVMDSSGRFVYKALYIVSVTIQIADNAERTMMMTIMCLHTLKFSEEEMEEMVVMECQDLEVSLAEMVRLERKE